MDRVLSKEAIRKKRRRIWIRVFIVLFLLVAGAVVGFNSLSPKVRLQNVLLSVADKGIVENSFITNGLVEPYYMELLVASFSANILEIKFVPGDKVTPSDTIFIPDISDLLNEKQDIENEIALKENRIKRSQEELQKSRIQLRSELKMDSIQIGHLKSAVEREEHLYKIGGGSQQKVEQVRIEYQLASIKIEGQLNDFESFKRLQKLDLESMEIELKLKYQEREKIIARIKKAYVQPKIDGIITSMLVEPGQHVAEGQTLAKVSDVQRFKVVGTISSRYADRIFLGQDAMILVNDSLLKGQLSAISPSVDQGTINFTVDLNDPSKPVLRSKLQVEVRLITSFTPKTIRIANGDYYFGSGNAELFVRNGDKLEKRKVKFGGASFDFVEVVSGINEGETVVISNSFNEQYKRYNTLKCTN
ncbi:MAG: HlyD family efflux transporter periplasmic adaptor subunit [Bacteroidales bacterium]|nr:HlyD family efflux transporter periplasmic adaptor subunit [Bacteroidales bacterium]